MKNLSKEQKDAGKAKFYETVGMNRRDFLKGGLLAGAVSGAGLGAMYFGYEKALSSPLRVGFIGTGDEGNVLLNAITPSYIQVVAIADIRPYNIHRAFHGDHSSESALKNRCGLMTKYGWKSEDEARRNVKVYDKDYHDLLADPDVEAIITALPLHMHAPVVIEAMKAGKHVITEKLMGHSVHECKEMARMAKKLDKILAVGHQRHYSILYDNAVDTIRRGTIGDIHHIRAQWNRGNLPGHDSWQPPLPGDKKLQVTLERLKSELVGARDSNIDRLQALVAQTEAQIADSQLDPRAYGYEDITLPGGRNRPAMEELIRWRLWNRTGGGLMAELGSHQLDASGIFISGLRSDGEKALPLTVSAVGNRNLFPVDRDCEDHVYCIYEFPGPKYDEDPSKVIGVTYSSINGNGWGGYGETVLGTKGTLLLEREQEVLLFPIADDESHAATNTKIAVSKSTSSVPTLDTTQSGGGEAAAVGKQALESGPPSRGYTEELEHWAWCIRNPDPKHVPRCNPKVALGDAVIALTTNIAMRENRRIEFDKKWFDIDSDETPEGVKPDISKYM